MSEAPQEKTPEAPAAGSAMKTLGIAVVVVLVLVFVVVFLLGGTSLLPMNYQGFDGK